MLFDQAIGHGHLPVLFPVRIVFDKPGKPNAAGKPHDQRLQENKKNGITAHPPEKAVVFERKADQYPPGDEGGHTEGNRQCITHIPRPVIESRLDFCGLATYRTFIVHPNGRGEMVCVPILENPARTAAWTTVIYNAGQVTGFAGRHV